MYKNHGCVVFLVMDTKKHILYVNELLKQAVLDNNWEAAVRFTFLLSILKNDLIIEQDRLIQSLRRVS